MSIGRIAILALIGLIVVGGFAAAAADVFDDDPSRPTGADSIELRKDDTTAEQVAVEDPEPDPTSDPGDGDNSEFAPAPAPAAAYGSGGDDTGGGATT